MAVEYHSLRELVELAEAQEKFVWEIVQQADMIESERTAEQSFAKMHEMYRQCGRQIRIMTERAVLQAGARAETEKSWNNIMRPETISADRLSEKSWKKQ